MKNRRSKNTRRRRGTIIILVTAVLALLAIIGTIFIISARAERSAANAASANVNTRLAQQAAMNTVVELIGNAMYDSKGNVGGYDATGTTYAKLAARNYDSPDCPPIYFPNPQLSLVNINSGATAANLSMRGEPWLAPTLHNNGANDSGLFFVPPSNPPPSPGFSGDAYLTSAGFDPATGAYDYPVFIYPVTSSTVTNTVNPVNVVDDQTVDAPSPNVNPDGSLTKTGNSVSTPNNDAYWNLLPISDASGIRYRYAVRILDTSRMANLNTGATDDSTTSGQGAMSDTFGTYLPSMRLAPVAVASANPPTWLSPAPVDYFNATDVGSNLHVPGTKGAGRAGTSTTNSTFNLANWQRQVVLQIEKPQDSLLSLFDLSDELELRSYGEFGTSYHARPTLGNGANYTLWPNTLSNNPSSPTSDTVFGNPARRNYTTYSFSREIRGYADPAMIYYLTPSSGSVASGFTWFPLSGAANPTANNVWPPSPARAAANPDIVTGNESDGDANFYVAMAATNIATAMQNAGFSPDEVCAFVANYITARTNVPQTHVLSSTAQTPVTTPVTAYYLPFGPSYVDSNGICIQSSTNAGAQLTAAFGGAQNYTSSSGGGNGNVYLGYSAQPFFNEVVVDRYQKPDPVTGAPTPFIADSAVELINPYGVALDLTGYQIQVDSNPIMPLDGLFVPANGFLVIYNGSGDLAKNIAKTSEKKSGLPQFVEASQGGGKVILRRLYTDRTGAKHYAAVDNINYANLLVPVAQLGTTDQDWSLERLSGLNPVTSQANTWGATMTSQAPTPTNNPTLGTTNATPGTLGLHLYDRTFDNTLTTTAQVRAVFTNIAEFNHLMRVSHVVDGSDNSVTSLEDHLNSILGNASPAAPYSALTGFPNEKFEAQLHFDFLPNAAMFNTSPPSDPGTMDFRAVKFLDQVAFIDRVSDATINVGGGVLDINKIRIPGQINVGTASGDVLRALPGMQLSMTALTPPPLLPVTALPDQIVANILSYRVRAGIHNTTFMTPILYNNATGKDYSDQGTYPGVGIRSLAELSIPINDAVLLDVPSAQQPTSLDLRDKLWASIYNLCTVRSDTFVVYGYLEALQMNPNNSANDNLSQWYSNSVLDGTNTTGSAYNTVRVARLRWVAIVDRSFCNYPVGSPNFQMPRIVAIKDLPR